MSRWSWLILVGLFLLGGSLARASVHAEELPCEAIVRLERVAAQAAATRAASPPPGCGPSRMRWVPRTVLFVQPVPLRVPPKRGPPPLPFAV